MNNITKPTFISLEIDKPTPRKFLIKHIVYSLTWIMGILILVFRGDLYLSITLSESYEWVMRIIPYIYLVLVITLMLFSKWYYSLCLLFYPTLLIFWFIPKIVLKKGKIYLLSSYVNLIVNRIKRFKSTIIHILITLFSVLLLFLTDSNVVRIISMIYFSFFYLKVVFKYIKKSLQPIQLFGINVEKAIDEVIKNPETSHSLLKSIEESKSDEKLDEEEKKVKRIIRLLKANTIIEYLAANLSGYKGKRAFIISWICQLLVFMLITVTYFTFINFELYIIDNESFKIMVEPSLFNFFYYTIKTLVFSNIESILPISIIAKIIEILSFFNVSVFAFIIIASIILSLKQDRIDNNIKKAHDVCVVQNGYIAEYIRQNYQMDIQSLLTETGIIKSSVENIKKIIEKIL